MDNNGIENQIELQEETFLEVGVVPQTVTEVIPVQSSLEILFSEIPFSENINMRVLISNVFENNLPLLFIEDFLKRAEALDEKKELTAANISLERSKDTLQLVIWSKQRGRIHLKYSPFRNEKELFIVNSKTQMGRELDCEEESTKVLIEEMVILCRSFLQAKKLVPPNCFRDTTERFFVFLLSYGRRDPWGNDDLSRIRKYLSFETRERIREILFDDLSIIDPNERIQSIMRDISLIQNSYEADDLEIISKKESLVEDKKGFFPDGVTIGGASVQILQKKKPRKYPF